MVAQGSSSLLTLRHEMDLFDPSVALAHVLAEEPLHQPVPPFLVSISARRFDPLAEALCLDYGVRDDVVVSRPAPSGRLLVNAEKLFHKTCANFRTRRASLGAVDHNAGRFADQLVMEGGVAATAVHYGLIPPPVIDPAYLQELDDVAQNLLWYGHDPERCRWGLNVPMGAPPAQGGGIWTLGFALVSGYCNQKQFPVKDLCRVSTNDVIRDWMGGDFALAPEGPPRQKRPFVPHWTIGAPRTAHA